MSSANYTLLADALLVLHGAFILWVVLGGLVVLRWPLLAMAHLPAAAWGVWIEWSGRICPLTPLEWALRSRAGQSGHGGGFIEHYVAAAIYPEGLTREVQFLLGAIVLLVNLAIYLRLAARLRARVGQRRRRIP